MTNGSCWYRRRPNGRDHDRHDEQVDRWAICLGARPLDPLDEPRGGEHGLLEEYSAVTKQSQSRAFRYLVNLLIEDESSYRRMFTALAQSLKTQALTVAEEPIIPDLDFDRADRTALLDATKRLIAEEGQDARELKRLQHGLHLVKDTSLWSLLVDLMRRDTEKRITLLRFVKKHAQNSPW